MITVKKDMEIRPNNNNDQSCLSWSVANKNDYYMN